MNTGVPKQCLLSTGFILLKLSTCAKKNGEKPVVRTKRLSRDFAGFSSYFQRIAPKEILVV